MVGRIDLHWLGSPLDRSSRCDTPNEGQPAARRIRPEPKLGREFLMSGVQSIERAFIILRVLAAGPAGVTELADRAELPKSTVYRLLGALEAAQAVEQVEAGGVYSLGQGLTDLVGAAAWSHVLTSAARPYLWELTEQIGETSGVSQLDQGQILYLEHFEADDEIQVRSWTGARIEPHQVASGLVVLAGQDKQKVNEYLTGELEASTPQSMTDPAAIRRRLKEVRNDGFCWMFEEFDEQLNSVAAPVVNPKGETVAALHVHGPAFRFPGEENPDAIAGLVRDAADRLAKQLT